MKCPTLAMFPTAQSTPLTLINVLGWHSAPKANGCTEGGTNAEHL